MAPAAWIPFESFCILFFLFIGTVSLSVFSKAILVTCVYTSWVQRHLQPVDKHATSKLRDQVFVQAFA